MLAHIGELKWYCYIAVRNQSFNYVLKVIKQGEKLNMENKKK